ncbi:LysR family transcriptional regulator [Herbaspirillum sp. AP02]|uniref:LysR family transcriptional regulator n=1 Tax=unclassified Herbaspirillum TaxID=2624150 RepID=UPI0015D9B051|nr:MULTISPECIES: LysR family transcriptional regulator [unclassified Herbaspirillum]MBG7620077.1 LysR family transcriptional regulator [Herbaspirillum sp. AP02]NZD69329.1 LysR family transcriptional regulator [Herbaspirillum sp. AP21]
MDKLQAMETFVAVVESGSFVSAVDVTGLSKPAVSRQVSELEQFLGIRLLHRTTRRLSLTDEGRVYFARCKELLESIQDVESEVGLNSDQACGRLRIGAPQDFGVEQLAPLWGRFAEDNPLITLNITLSDRTIDLIEEGFDMVIRISTLGDSRMVARPLAPVRMIACASPEFLRRHGRPETPAELREYPFISYSYRANGDEWSFRHVHGDTCHVRVRSTVYVNNGVTCREMAIAGQGIAIQPDFIVNAAIASGQLVELFEGWSTGEQLVVHTLYPTRTHLPPKVQRMRDFLVEQFKVPPWCPKPAT